MDNTVVDTFLDLPVDLLRSVFCLLSYPHLARCACVNKRLSTECWLGMEIFFETSKPAFDFAVGFRLKAAARTFPSLIRCQNLIYLGIPDWHSVHLKPESLGVVFSRLEALGLPLSDESPLPLGTFDGLKRLTRLITPTVPSISTSPSLSSLRSLDLIFPHVNSMAPINLSEVCAFEQLRTLCINFVPATIFSVEIIRMLCSHPHLELIQAPFPFESWSDAEFEVISTSPRAPLLLDMIGETYFGHILRMLARDIFGYNTEEYKRGLLSSAVERWRKYPSSTTNPNSRNANDLTALHTAIQRNLTSTILTLLDAGAKADLLMPQPGKHPYFRTATPALQDDYTLPLSTALLFGLELQVISRLWNATSDICAGAVSPWLAASLCPDARMMAFVREKSLHDQFHPFQTFFRFNGYYVEPTNILFECIRKQGIWGIDAIPDDEFLRHSDEIDAFLSEASAAGETRAHLLCLTKAPPGSTPARPPLDNWDCYAKKVLARLLPFMKNQWIKNSKGWFPLDSWLHNPDAPFLDEIPIPADVFWTHWKEVPSAPMFSHLQRLNAEPMWRMLFQQAQSPGNVYNVAETAAQLLTHCDFRSLAYFLCGCPGDLKTFPDVGHLNMTAIPPLVLREDEFDPIIDGLLDPKCSLFDEPVLRWVSLLIRSNAPAVKSADFAVRLLRPPSRIVRNSCAMDLFDIGLNISHPQLLQTALDCGLFGFARELRKRGALASSVVLSRIPLVHSEPYFDEVVDLVSSGADPMALNDSDQTLLEKIVWHRNNDPPADVFLSQKALVLCVVSLIRLGARWRQPNLDLAEAAFSAAYSSGLSKEFGELLSALPAKGLPGDNMWTTLLESPSLIVTNSSAVLANLLAEHQIGLSKPLPCAKLNLKSALNVFPALCMPCFLNFEEMEATRLSIIVQLIVRAREISAEIQALVKLVHDTIRDQSLFPSTSRTSGLINALLLRCNESTDLAGVETLAERGVFKDLELSACSSNPTLARILNVIKTVEQYGIIQNASVPKSKDQGGSFSFNLTIGVKKDSNDRATERASLFSLTPQNLPRVESSSSENASKSEVPASFAWPTPPPATQSASSFTWPTSSNGK